MRYHLAAKPCQNAWRETLMKPSSLWFAGIEIRRIRVLAEASRER
jgi:hypothetical protein